MEAIAQGHTLDPRVEWGAETDENLMLMYGEGDTAAFEELYHRHKGSVYAFIRRFITREEMWDDLFQSVFFRVIQNRKNYKVQARFTTWLFTIARSVCIDVVRKRSYRATVSLGGCGEDGPAVEEALHEEGTAREWLYQAEIREALERILRTLPPEQREVLLLREHTAMTFDEIGTMLGISTNTAKSRMHYALTALRRGLQQQGMEG